MPKRREKPIADTEADITTKLEQVTLRIKREHILTPHSIELRRNGGDHVVEARTADHRHSEPLGAKTVLQILSENGAEMMLQADTDQLEIKFSPLTGEIVSIAPFKEAEMPDNSKDSEEEKSGEAE